MATGVAQPTMHTHLLVYHAGETTDNLNTVSKVQKSPWPLLLGLCTSPQEFHNTDAEIVPSRPWRIILA